MTHEQFRAALDQQQNAAFHAGALLGYQPRVIRLSLRIEANLYGAESQNQLASEDPGMAAYHRRQAARYIAAARSLIDGPDGKEAFALYKERTGQ